MDTTNSNGKMEISVHCVIISWCFIMRVTQTIIHQKRSSTQPRIPGSRERCEPMSDPPQEAKVTLHEVLPKAGLVYSEKGNLSEVLCKPKIMPIKSTSLEKLEALEAQAAKMQPGIPQTGLQQT